MLGVSILLAIIHTSTVLVHRKVYFFHITVLFWQTNLEIENPWKSIIHRWFIFKCLYLFASRPARYRWIGHATLCNMNLSLMTCSLWTLFHDFPEALSARVASRHRLGIVFVYHHFCLVFPIVWSFFLRPQAFVSFFPEIVGTYLGRIPNYLFIIFIQGIDSRGPGNEYCNPKMPKIDWTDVHTISSLGLRPVVPADDPLYKLNYWRWMTVQVGPITLPWAG